LKSGKRRGETYNEGCRVILDAWTESVLQCLILRQIEHYYQNLLRAGGKNVRDL